MAENQGVWGIEIGQAGLKAIRLRYAEAAEQVLAVAFDYIPHPKILSQPDAVPAELINQALTTFLERNDLKGDKVVISVPGQTALARFIQLPPVPAPKVPEIVKFEARQQIPFALEDVIWDYQVLSVGSEESDFMLDAEVGLFAMKRDQVMEQLNPFTMHKVEVDAIQIAPLGLYNVLYYDQMGIRPDDEEQQKDDHFIILDMGADNTTLVVTNGSKIWIRNVPVGGNHFTRALTKEMKLTFAKAEHLKCNATKSPDPRAVFKALQPVFNDYVSEIQRSIGYFSSVNRNAKIKKLIGVGNGFKLAGLQKFLQQNLTQFEVERLSGYKALVGDNVLNAALFEENLLTFTVPYGLALQGLKRTKVHTSLLPPEIATARKIQQKKPWAASAAAALLLGVSLSAVSYANVEDSVSKDRFGGAEDAVAGLQTRVTGYTTEYEAKKTKHEEIVATGRVVIDQLNARENWLEVYKAINECLPKDTAEKGVDISLRDKMKLQSITAEKLTDLATQWYAALQPDQVNSMRKEDQKPPEGPGYLFTLTGVHYHHEDDNATTGQADRYVANTLLKNLKQWKSSDNFGVRKIGITHPVLIEADIIPLRYRYSPDIREQRMILGQSTGGGLNGGMDTDGSDMDDSGFDADMFQGDFDGTDEEGKVNEDLGQEIRQTRFVVQFVWQPVPQEKRVVHEIIMSKVAPHELSMSADLGKKPEPNLEVPFEEIEQEIARLNEEIARENLAIRKENASLPEDEATNRRLERELIKFTPEEYEAFKQRFLVKGTAETRPSALRGAAATDGQDGGAGATDMGGPGGGH